MTSLPDNGDPRDPANTTTGCRLVSGRNKKGETNDQS